MVDIGKIVKQYLEKYPDIASHTLSKMIYHDYPQVFTSKESIRTRIRYYRGKSGLINKQIIEKKYGKCF